MEIQLYYLPGIPRISAQTGKTIGPERGPFVAQILGGRHRYVTTEEIVQYAVRVHGEEPIRIEREEVLSRRKAK